MSGLLSLHGVRVTVRFHGAVVGQTVHWPWSSRRIGLTVPESVPTAGPTLARLVWRGGAAVALLPDEPGVQGAELTPGERWRWQRGDVDVDVDMVPLERARRGERQAGDLALLALVLLLTVAVGQLNLLASLLTGEAQGSGQAVAEPSPEYIARLLQQDLDGEEDGPPERIDRPEPDKDSESFYMPAGNDGPKDRTGGGAVAGDEVVRVVPEDKPSDDEGEPADTVRAPTVQGQTEALADAATPKEGVHGAPDQEAEEDAARARARDPMERFIGWGFRDWFDVKDSRADALERQMRRELDMVRRRLKIDPDDPWAINVLGYYAYLAENHALGEQAFTRLIDHYPEDPAGYNNLALVYKRKGEYTKEEALYRRALELAPMDDNVMNNLAVNLAHQGRFDEAIAIMDQLEEIMPGDPYADLHRAKIYAAMGKRERAYRYLKQALEGTRTLDTMHHIEFRQDIRLDPAFTQLRTEARFRRLLEEVYGDDAAELLPGGSPGGAGQGSEGG